MISTHPSGATRKNSEAGAVRPLVVIPVYNHPATLRSVVTGTLKVCNDVLVVDDGSSDAVAEIIKDLSVSVIRHESNLGKGAAILTAAREAKRLGMSHIITIDADGQHDPADITAFIPVITQHPMAIVLGKRRFDKRSVPFASRFGRGFSNFWLRVETGHLLQDTQSGFRAYPIAVLEWLKLREKGYTFEIEVLVKAAWALVEFKEIDISVHYPERDKRISHFDPFMDNLGLTILNTRLTLRAILPFPHKPFVAIKSEGDEITILHPLKSLRTLLRKNVSPEQLAASGGLGIFLGTLPLIACQSVVILMTANFFRLNRYAALGTSQLCNPPIVPALCIEVGYFIRHGRFLTEISLRTLGYQGLERILEWIIGALILGPVLGGIMGGIIYVITFFLKRERSVKSV